MGVASDRIRHQSPVLDNRYQRSSEDCEGWRVVDGTGEEGDREIKGGRETDIHVCVNVH